MEDDSELLEEGEVLDSCNISTNTNHFTLSRETREPQTICSEESSNDNSENSDDDSDGQCSRPKRVKYQQSESPVIKKNEVPNKYKVWSQAIQEESLMETLIKCDVETIDRERNVEAYNYKIAEKTDYSQFSGYHMPVSECHYLESDYVRSKDEKQYLIGSKRRRHDGNGKKHLKHKHIIYARGLPRLEVTSENSIEEVATDIAYKLREKKVNLIRKVVLVLGKEKAIALYNETKGVEDNGGMLIMNQERRRTAGGVYLLLLKRDNTITSDEMEQIFVSDIMEIRVKRKLKSKNNRRKSFEDFKETIIREKLLCLNTTKNVQDLDSKPLEVPLDSESNNLEDGELNVTNPPPSPATDQDTSPSRIATALSDEEEVVQGDEERLAQPDTCTRPVISYDDDEDYLELDLVDDIDMF